MTKKESLETYAKVILHSGCALKEGDTKHSWDDCPMKELHLRAARKHQHKLKSNGMCIGIWIDETKYKIIRKYDDSPALAPDGYPVDEMGG